MDKQTHLESRVASWIEAGLIDAQAGDCILIFES
jgi:hypothetical protein